MFDFSISFSSKTNSLCFTMCSIELFDKFWVAQINYHLWHKLVFIMALCLFDFVRPCFFFLVDIIQFIDFKCFKLLIFKQEITIVLRQSMKLHSIDLILISNLFSKLSLKSTHDLCSRSLSWLLNFLCLFNLLFSFSFKFFSFYSHLFEFYLIQENTILLVNQEPMFDLNQNLTVV